MANSSPPPSFQAPSSLPVHIRNTQTLSQHSIPEVDASARKIPNLHSRVFAAPNPSRILFDPFNSSSTGHQLAENRLAGSTAWRISRTQKLAYQFRDDSGRGGDNHKADLVGAGSAEWEAFVKGGGRENESKRRREVEMNVGKIQGLSRTLDSKYAGTAKGDWEMGRVGVVNGEDGLRDIRHAFGQSRSVSISRKRKRTNEIADEQRCRKDCDEISTSRHRETTGQDGVYTLRDIRVNPRQDHGFSGSSQINDEINSSSRVCAISDGALDVTSPPRQIFAGLSIYLNGSTAPLISDLRLKQLFAQHGGTTSLNWAKKTVTHIILGESSSFNAEDSALHGGAGGGGLASSKIQKEIRTVRGKSLKFVTARWVVDSIKAGKRLPEHKYVPEEVWGRLAGLGSGYRNGRAPFEDKVNSKKQSVLGWLERGKK